MSGMSGAAGGGHEASRDPAMDEVRRVGLRYSQLHDQLVEHANKFKNGTGRDEDLEAMERLLDKARPFTEAEKQMARLIKFLAGSSRGDLVAFLFKSRLAGLLYLVDCRAALNALNVGNVLDIQVDEEGLYTVRRCGRAVSPANRASNNGRRTSGGARPERTRAGNGGTSRAAQTPPEESSRLRTEGYCGFAGQTARNPRSTNESDLFPLPPRSTSVSPARGHSSPRNTGSRREPDSGHRGPNSRRNRRPQNAHGGPLTAQGEGERSVPVSTGKPAMNMDQYQKVLEDLAASDAAYPGLAQAAPVQPKPRADASYLQAVVRGSENLAASGALTKSGTLTSSGPQMGNTGRATPSDASGDKTRGNQKRASLSSCLSLPQQTQTQTGARFASSSQTGAVPVGPCTAQGANGIEPATSVSAAPSPAESLPGSPGNVTKPSSSAKKANLEDKAIQEASSQHAAATSSLKEEESPSSDSPLGKTPERSRSPESIPGCKPQDPRLSLAEKLMKMDWSADTDEDTT
jgi:hypothetical protein